MATAASAWTDCLLHFLGFHVRKRTEQQHGGMLQSNGPALSRRGFTGASPMDTPFNAESNSPPKYNDFTVILGCVFLSILITASILGTTRLILNWTGLN